MHKYESSPTPNIPGESSQVQHLLGRLATAEKQFDGNADVLVANLPMLQKNPDGSVITRNADGLITTVLTPTGIVRHLAYDKNGALVEFNDGQNYLYKLENGCFHQYEPNGIKATGFSLVENEADCDYEGNLTIYQPDGSNTIAKTDGSVIEVDSHGKVLQVNYSDTRALAIEYDATGKVFALVDSVTGERLVLSTLADVLIDALGLISIVKNGMGYILRTDGTCLIVDFDETPDRLLCF